MIPTRLTPTPSDARRGNRRLRRHRLSLESTDRRTLEVAGWRTLLEYRENLVRDADGTLLDVLPRWTGEAERDRPAANRPGEPRAQVVTVTADSPAEVWAELRRLAT
jgi:hypothetical protein